MPATAKQLVQHLAALFFPHHCAGCGSDVLQPQDIICIRCVQQLPHTGFASLPNNPAEKIFWGRLALQAAHSEFYFAKQSLIQHLVHQLKYRGNRPVGIYLGQLLGKSISKSNRFSSVQAIVPLPLFLAKEKKRGYNQAAVICQGMSEIMQVPVLEKVLVRQRFTDTQTKKHRTERWQNVADSFAVTDAGVFTNKHLLLVDDVVTTGATLEAAGSKLLEVKGVNLSVATLMLASK
jgi:ComF family protein